MSEMRDANLDQLRADLLVASLAAMRSAAPESLKDELAIALGRLAEAKRGQREPAVEIRRAHAVLAAWGEYQRSQVSNATEK